MKEAEYFCHAFVRADSLAGICFSDHEYPPRVAHTMLSRVLDDFAGSRVSDPHFFLADPDPGKNLHADPDPGGIRGRGLGVREKINCF